MTDSMGRYIDGLDDEGRDRIVMAPDFLGGLSWWNEKTQCGCLVGTVEQGQVSVEYSATAFLWRNSPPWLRFPVAMGRFGKDRLVRAIKARAGAKVRIAEPVAVGAV